MSDRGKNLSVKPPRELLEADSEYGAGLGLDRGEYDNDDPLCFDALVEDGLVALAPVGYESTLTASREGETPASASPADGTEDDSPSETSGEDAASSYPLSEEAVSAAAQATGVSMTALRDALATVSASVDVDELATAPDYDLLDVDDRRVLVVPDRVWSDLQARLDLEADVLEAARLAHTRMAETLVVDAEASEYRRFSKEYDALVV